MFLVCLNLNVYLGVSFTGTPLRHPALAEFAISLEGFPESATDEEQILEFVRQSFGASAEQKLIEVSFFKQVLVGDSQMTFTHIPRTQMTLVLIEKGLVLEG